MTTKLDPEILPSHNIRGMIWLHRQEWSKVKADLILAKEKGMDIIALFDQTYGSVAAFEENTGIQLPPDIVALLTSAQP